MTKRFLLLLLTAIMCLPRAEADESTVPAGRPITSLYGIEAGGLNSTNTYLNPLPFTGWSLGLFGGWGKEMKQNPEHLVMAFTADIGMSRGLNPAKSGQLLSATFHFGWGPAYRLKLPYNLTLTAGGALDLFAGINYLSLNSNNPVNIMAYTGIDVTTGLSETFKIGRLPVTIADRVSLPTLGAFFMPGYGETLYEIYLGNRSGLAHFGWWGNCFGINNHLSFTMHFGKRSLSVGYRLNVRTFHANNLVTQYVRNAFTIALRIN